MSEIRTHIQRIERERVCVCTGVPRILCCARCVKWELTSCCSALCIALHLDLDLRLRLRSEHTRSRLSATLSSPSYTGSSLFIHLCPSSYEFFRHNPLPLPLVSCPTSLTSIAFCPHSSSHSSVIFSYTLVYHMSATVRQPKPTKKVFAGDNPSARFAPLTPSTSSANVITIISSRQSAWGGARSSPSFSPSPNNARLPNGPPPATSTQAASFPPLGPATPTPRQDHKSVLQNLASHAVRVVFHFAITAGSYSCSLPKRGQSLLSLPRPRNATKVSSCPLLKAKGTQLALPFVM